MKKILLLFITIFLGNQILEAQSRAYTVKGGLTVGTQRWEDTQQDPLFRYHGIVGIESAPQNNTFALFAQVGYHVKGSAWRNNLFRNISGQGFTILSQDFEFRNLSLTIGAKKKFTDRGNATLYYLFGVRGDYNIGTNLAEYEAANLFANGPVYPVEGAVQDITYGMTLGGGAEVPVSEFVSAIFELTLNPDLREQYRQPSFVSNSSVLVNPRTFSERRITNLTLEFSVGFRFLHKIEYID